MNTDVLVGDCIEQLRILESGSVNCIVTSPPYWGLRDYGTASWEGGSHECDHKELGVRGGVGEASSKQVTSAGASTTYQYKYVCGKCGAVRKDMQIGLERTPEEYVEKMVQVFRECRRVLRDDGTLWLNLGDSYWNSNGFARASDEFQREGRNDAPANDRRLPSHDTLKVKDLVGIPWRVAFALQSDGWWLRSDIIWAKPNPMPESVTDHPTRAHEYIFLLTKSARYWYDAAAIRESRASDNNACGPSSRANVDRVPKPNLKQNMIGKGTDAETDMMNKRTVWTVAPAQYPKAHFATYPPELIKPCILAGCPQGGTVLDPFAGSGTTLATAIELGRNAIGIELNPSYTELIQERIMSVTPGMDL